MLFVDIDASLVGQIVIINRLYISTYDNFSSLDYWLIVQKIQIELTRHYMMTETLRFTFVSVTVIQLFAGSVGADYVVTFNSSDGLSEEKLQREFLSTLYVKANGTFLGDDFQISNNTDPNQVGNSLKFKDYDECHPAEVVHIPDCGINSRCVNLNMTYVCTCNEGYENNGNECTTYYQGKSKEDGVDTVLFVALIVPVSVFFVMAFIIIAAFMVRASRRSRRKKEEIESKRSIRSFSLFLDRYFGDETNVY